MKDLKIAPAEKAAECWDFEAWDLGLGVRRIWPFEL